MIKYIATIITFISTASLIADEGSFTDSSNSMTDVGSTASSFQAQTIDKNLHPYLGVGISSLVIIPYGTNYALGARYAHPGQIVGADVSLNYTTTFISHYWFAKGLLPIYFSPETPKSSYYFGPFATLGYNHQKTNDEGLDFFDDLPPGGSLLAVTGVTFGKNIDSGNRVSFWQVSANFHRFSDHKLETNIWPTVTFQYGIGF